MTRPDGFQELKTAIINKDKRWGIYPLSWGQTHCYLSHDQKQKFGIDPPSIDEIYDAKTHLALRRRLTPAMFDKSSPERR